MTKFYNPTKSDVKIMMPIALIFVMLFFCKFGQLQAQEGCYNRTRSGGIAAMDKKDYEKAIKWFEQAKGCPDKPSDNDLESLIKNCNEMKKKAEEKRKQYAEEKRLKEVHEHWEREQTELRETQMAGNAYMDITGCTFYNYASGFLLSKDSDFLYAEDIVYLLPVLDYDGMAEDEREVTLYCKLFSPDGTILMEEDTLNGFSFLQDVIVEPGIGNQIRLEPLGWNTPFIPGIYVLEVYASSGRKLLRSSCALLEKAPEIKSARVTFIADDKDVSIFINNVYKGKGAYMDAFEYGIQYKVESRKANHSPLSQIFTITKDMDGQIIQLDAPQPILGSILIESTPKYADIYIDGNKIGTTPLNVTEILIGEHQLKLSKEGYMDYMEIIIVREEDSTPLNIKMSR